MTDANSRNKKPLDTQKDQIPKDPKNLGSSVEGAHPVEDSSNPNNK